MKPNMPGMQALAAECGINETQMRILINRGITEADAVRRYLNDDLSLAHDPALMKDMDTGCGIMAEKIRSGSKIRIISDYDVDGITSNYILYTGLKQAGAEVSYDIPERVQDGYGMNVRIVEQAVADGVDTIITCDNGVAAFEAVAYAKAHGMTVIVTDHHEIPCDVDDAGQKHYRYVQADALIDPHRPDCGYPYKNLCGAGVAYKFIRHLYKVMELSWLGEEYLMDILALGTVCDVMPLTEENRLFVKHGLRRLTYSENVGICALKEAQGLTDKEIRVHHLAFMIGPCLNSTGRLESAKEGVQLLLEEDPAVAATMAAEMVALNQTRKDMTDGGVLEGVTLVQQNTRLVPEGSHVIRKAVGDDHVIVLYLPDIHESVAGLVASKVKDAFYRPTLIFTNAEGKKGILKGSGRSIEGYDMFMELSKARELFERMGGHPMAAGFSIKAENLEPIREVLNANEKLSENDLTEKLYVDVSLPPRGLTLALYEELERLEPYGVANPRPVFGFTHMKIAGIRLCGKENQYARCTFSSKKGERISGMVFRGKELLDRIKEWFGEEECDRILRGQENQAEIDILFHLVKNEYNGMITMQIEPIAFRKSEME